MKILFQGGWKEGRDPEDTRELIENYCNALAKYVVLNNHQLVLSSYRDYDKLISLGIQKAVAEEGKEIKDHLFYFLSDRIKKIPNKGVVKQIDRSRWWIEERTFAVQNSDIVIAIGGGKGTFDCVEKSFLSNKPVFIVTSIRSPATEAWKRKGSNYKYLNKGDADFIDDLNITPDEFFQKTFKIINSIEQTKYSRKVFVVHGRDQSYKNDLVSILIKLDFQPVVAQDEPNKSLTIIEKLERDTEEIGFCFVLYTPDDIGNLVSETPICRARQNVVFEHGLLIGLLGRKRTCAIIKGDLETPSDVHGMLFEKINDIQQESLKIAKVLKDAGYKVNVSKLI